MKIRIMKIEDYEQVYQLWLSCSGLGLNDLDDSKQGIERFLNRNPETCFVVENDNYIIGAIMVGNDGRRAYIYHLAILPAYQKQGIGKQLVQVALKKLEDLQIHKVALVVFKKNINAQLFWEKLGFIQRNDLIYRNISLVEMKRIET